MLRWRFDATGRGRDRFRLMGPTTVGNGEITIGATATQTIGVVTIGATIAQTIGAVIVGAKIKPMIGVLVSGPMKSQKIIWKTIQKIMHIRMIAAACQILRRAIRTCCVDNPISIFAAQRSDCGETPVCCFLQSKISWPCSSVIHLRCVSWE